MDEKKIITTLLMLPRVTGLAAGCVGESNLNGGNSDGAATLLAGKLLNLNKGR